MYREKGPSPVLYTNKGGGGHNRSPSKNKPPFSRILTTVCKYTLLPCL